MPLVVNHPQFDQNLGDAQEHTMARLPLARISRKVQLLEASCGTLQNLLQILQDHIVQSGARSSLQLGDMCPSSPSGHQTREASSRAGHAPPELRVPESIVHTVGQLANRLSHNLREAAQT